MKTKRKLKNNPRLKFRKTDILTVVAAAGVVATFVLTIRDTHKAEKKLDELKEEIEEPTTKEIIKETAPCYAPSLAVAGATMFFIFGSNYINHKQQLSLISAYTLAHGQYARYRDKVKDIYGQEAHERILDSLAVEKAKEVNLEAPSVVENAGRSVDSDEETRLFYDSYLNRYFEAPLTAVMDAEYHLNRNYTLRGRASIYEWCEFLGIEAPDGADYIGWDMCGEHDGIYWVDFEHHMTNIGQNLDDYLECIVIDMIFEPCDFRMSEIDE